MAESFLVRESLGGALRHIEVHAVTDPESQDDSNFIPLLKVVDVSLGMRSFSRPGILPLIETNEGETSESLTLDSVLTASHAAAAIVAFFGEEPVGLTYFIPDEHMHHMPPEFIEALPDPLSGDIQRVMAVSDSVSDLEPKLSPYDPSGPYL